MNNEIYDNMLSAYDITTEQKLLLLPKSFLTRCFVLPDLFAGKMHA